MIKIDGNAYRDELIEQYRKEIEEDALKIKLDIILVGENPSSKIYVNQKIKYAEKAGIKTELHHLESDVTTEEVASLISKLNEDKEVTGIILQSPAGNIDFDLCAGMILPHKDIDGFTKTNIMALYGGKDMLLPCTVKGILKLLLHYGVTIEGKNVVIIGRSKIVGKPLALALTNRNATVTLCHSHTENLGEFTKRADILISAVGHPGLVTAEMVKDGFVGIDVGTTRVVDEKSGKGVLKGDFDFENIKDKASIITPVPGGVGPMTVACVVGNLVKAKRLEKEVYGKTVNLKNK